MSVERIVELGDAGSVQLTVAPARAGFNQIHLYLFDPDGRPAEIAESVTLVLTPARRPTSARSPATPCAPGPPTSSSTATTWRSPGTWTFEVRARVDRFTEEAGSTEVPIAP